MSDSNSRTSESAVLYSIFVILCVTAWGLSISHQITVMSRTFNQALNARQVVIVPYHATILASDPETPPEN